jgi:hypothetical protein
MKRVIREKAYKWQPSKEREKERKREREKERKREREKERKREREKEHQKHRGKKRGSDPGMRADENGIEPELREIKKEKE